MNWDRIQGEWKQMTAQVKSKWAKLTDEDLKLVSAKKDALVGKIQERYGVLRDEAEKQVDEWLAKMPKRKDKSPERHDGGTAGGQPPTS
jgi:uncharacterized protein YjbJ (UPF0337 family)